jgi:RNA polymerase-binding transcription factor DksA
MDTGTYGRCVDCGEPIGWQRLQAVPAAARCVACQSKVEQTPPAAHFPKL